MFLDQEKRKRICYIEYVIEGDIEGEKRALKVELEKKFNRELRRIAVEYAKGSAEDVQRI